jgi:hypothetical protein
MRSRCARPTTYFNTALLKDLEQLPLDLAVGSNRFNYAYYTSISKRWYSSLLALTAIASHLSSILTKNQKVFAVALVMEARRKPHRRIASEFAANFLSERRVLLTFGKFIEAFYKVERLLVARVLWWRASVKEQSRLDVI